MRGRACPACSGRGRRTTRPVHSASTPGYPIEDDQGQSPRSSVLRDNGCMSRLLPMDQRILDAAQHLLQAHGYHGVSYATIAAHVGLRKASVFHLCWLRYASMDSRMTIVASTGPHYHADGSRSGRHSAQHTLLTWATHSHHTVVRYEKRHPQGGAPVQSVVSAERGAAVGPTWYRPRPLRRYTTRRRNTHTRGRPHRASGP